MLHMSACLCIGGGGVVVVVVVKLPIKSHQVHNQDVDGREVRIGLFESLALHLIRINDFNFFLSIDYSLSAKDGPNAFWTTTLKAQVMSFSCI